MAKLTVIGIRSIRKIGLHSDGGGLYLKVQRSSDPNQPNKSWIFRWGTNGKHTMGLGSLRDCTLAEARARAAEAHKQFKAGLDPRVERDKERSTNSVALGTTFSDAATEYINIQKGTWKNKKSADQWANTLKTYAYPKIGNIPCSEISPQHIVSILTPIWDSKHETATRLRGRIESIWDMAKAKGLCKGENPATLKGNLVHRLPRINRRLRIKHHESMAYSQIPEFMASIYTDLSTSAKALRMCILTATRTSETIQAEWSEFNLDEKIWIIPRERMKKGREQRIPLSNQVLNIIESLLTLKNSKYLFPSQKDKNKSISNMAMLTYLKRRESCTTLTVHGFRSSFRDWAGEKSHHPREVIEHALAHGLADQTEAAYQRGDYFDKRIELMDEWASYCTEKINYDKNN